MTSFAMCRLDHLRAETRARVGLYFVVHVPLGITSAILQDGIVMSEVPSVPWLSHQVRLWLTQPWVNGVPAWDIKRVLVSMT
jgi:hypothetical protein